MINHQHKTDEQLVALTLKEREMFLFLMQRYEQKLMHYIYRISSSSKEDAEDILQDVFMKAYSSLQGFDQKKSFSSWLYRITHNETISHFRKKKARPSIAIDVDDLARFADELNLSDALDTRLLQEQVRAIMNELDDKYRDVLVLKYLEGKSYDDIAAIIRKPKGTVGTLINRAKKKFTTLYEKRY